YKHGAYQSFNISDPKPRNIHKALVRDRFLHHAVYRQLYPLFDRTFIADSYSCRIGKGTHRAINRFRLFGSRVSRNNTRTAWILKCDIRKFFANIDHQVLINILREHIADEKILWLLSEIIGSFQSKREGVGLPLGNLTSQLLVNIYMNRFDQFAKHKLKAKYYIRYADDFVIFSEKKEDLENLIQQVGEYLQDELKLELHPKKVSIGSLASGVDFLGWVHFSDHRVLRTTTKRRMIKMIQEKPKPETINSYLGMLKHGNACKLREEIF
ncbi:MAG: reverse transcriptase/maturase family protein, partial [Patescibacteria group bacterium]